MQHSSEALANYNLFVKFLLSIDNAINCEKRNLNKRLAAGTATSLQQNITAEKWPKCNSER